jgi:hypothetical protein
MKKLNIKSIICLLVGLLLNSNIHLAISQEYGQVILVHNEAGWKNKTIEIKENTMFKVLTARYGGSNVHIEVNYKENTFELNGTAMYDAQVMGPATITFKVYAGQKLLCFYVVNELDQKSSKHALVLPEGADGKQKLVLESSTDLVNWTEDSLGSKDSSDKKRFYRLRAVKE